MDEIARAVGHQQGADLPRLRVQGGAVRPHRDALPRGAARAGAGARRRRRAGGAAARGVRPLHPLLPASTRRSWTARCRSCAARRPSCASASPRASGCGSGSSMAACLAPLAAILADGMRAGVFAIEDPDFTANRLYTQVLGHDAPRAASASACARPRPACPASSRSTPRTCGGPACEDALALRPAQAARRARRPRRLRRRRMIASAIVLVRPVRPPDDLQRAPAVARQRLELRDGGRLRRPLLRAVHVRADEPGGEHVRMRHARAGRKRRPSVRRGRLVLRDPGQRRASPPGRSAGGPSGWSSTSGSPSPGGGRVVGDVGVLRRDRGLGHAARLPAARSGAPHAPQHLGHGHGAVLALAVLEHRDQVPPRDRGAVERVRRGAARRRPPGGSGCRAGAPGSRSCSRSR